MQGYSGLAGVFAYFDPPTLKTFAPAPTRATHVVLSVSLCSLWFNAVRDVTPEALCPLWFNAVRDVTPEAPCLCGSVH
jgi:hypothetical protein